MLLLLAAWGCGGDAGDLPVGPPRASAPIPQSRRHATATIPPEPAVEDAPAPEDAEPATPSLVVDHAWVKDADTLLEQQQRRRSMEQLRLNVGRGMTFDAAWNALHVAPEVWHVGERETYPLAVIPPEARDLPAGTLSPVIPGNGGLHLFRILGRDDAE